MTDEYAANADTSGGLAHLGEVLSVPSARKRNRSVEALGSICLGITTLCSVPIFAGGYYPSYLGAVWCVTWWKKSKQRKDNE